MLSFFFFLSIPCAVRSSGLQPFEGVPPLRRLDIEREIDGCRTMRVLDGLPRAQVRRERQIADGTRRVARVRTRLPRSPNVISAVIRPDPHYSGRRHFRRIYAKSPSASLTAIKFTMARNNCRLYQIYRTMNFRSGGEFLQPPHTLTDSLCTNAK